jgi:vancomycin permeability regulator SanA
MPHAWATSPRRRFLVGGIICGFLALSIANILGFYHALHQGRLRAALPVPFSALIASILAAEAARVIAWDRPDPRLPLPARRFVGGVSVVGAFLALILAHIVTFGLTDYAPAVESADASVLLGAKVYADGRLSNALEDRLSTGVDLFREGRVRCLILSGGVEPGGLSEPRAMAARACALGVPPAALILDEEGKTTYHSARNCGAIARAHGFQRLLVVSQYFHNARVKLIFEREGTPCYTVPAHYRPLLREGYFLLRETIAFPFYFLYYR